MLGAEQSRAEQSRAEQSRAEQSRAEQSRAGVAVRDRPLSADSVEKVGHSFRSGKHASVIEIAAFG